jgi:S-formylglutathione hydrolase FrmB
MYSHVVNELPRVILTLNLPIVRDRLILWHLGLSKVFPRQDLSRQSVFGHSMGGHGALILYLRSFPKFRSVSAFSPVANPSQSPWGKKAFEGYLNNGVEEGKIQWDATELLKRKDLKGNDVKVLIDVVSFRDTKSAPCALSKSYDRETRINSINRNSFSPRISVALSCFSHVNSYLLS